MWQVFNMGLGFCVIVAAERAHDAAALLEGRHPGATIVGAVTDRSGVVGVPGLGIAGDRDGLRAA
jgi:phosphoribosylformylglycinamidine cyclo-ligase